VQPSRTQLEEKNNAKSGIARLLSFHCLGKFIAAVMPKLSTRDGQISG